MVKSITLLIASVVFMQLSACTPIKLPVVNQYRLEAFNAQRLAPPPGARTLLISQPDATDGYQTEQMLYIKTPYQLAAFSENAWVTSPANMLFPLIIQTFESSHAFSAITSSPYANHVDYRLDSQIIAMQQNFLTKPSQFELTLKIVLTQVKNNEVMLSKILTERIKCPMESPYGGVVAGNHATTALTGKIKQLIINAIKQYEALS